MVFGIEKCKTLSIAKGKIKMKNFTTTDADTVEAIMEYDVLYRYLGHMQSKQIIHTQIKQKLGEEYLKRTKSIVKTKLNGKKYDKSYQYLRDPSTDF